MSRETDITFLEDYTPYRKRTIPDAEVLMRLQVVAQSIRDGKDKWLSVACKRLNMSRGSVGSYGRELRAACKAGYASVEKYMDAGRPCKRNRIIEPEEGPVTA